MASPATIKTIVPKLLQCITMLLILVNMNNIFSIFECYVVESQSEFWIIPAIVLAIFPQRWFSLLLLLFVPNSSNLVAESEVSKNGGKDKTADEMPQTLRIKAW